MSHLVRIFSCLTNMSRKRICFGHSLIIISTCCKQVKKLENYLSDVRFLLSCFGAIMRIRKSSRVGANICFIDSHMMFVPILVPSQKNRSSNLNTKELLLRSLKAEKTNKPTNLVHKRGVLNRSHGNSHDHFAKL